MYSIFFIYIYIYYIHTCILFVGYFRSCLNLGFRSKAGDVLEDWWQLIAQTAPGSTQVRSHRIRARSDVMTWGFPQGGAP